MDIFKENLSSVLVNCYLFINRKPYEPNRDQNHNHSQKFCEIHQEPFRVNPISIATASKALAAEKVLHANGDTPYEMSINDS